MFGNSHMVEGSALACSIKLDRQDPHCKALGYCVYRLRLEGLGIRIY